MKCPYCGGEATLKDSSIIYGKSYGNVFICENYPECNTYVGVHKASNKPLGILADAETRELRKQCHSLFDPFWQSGDMTRKEAYAMLARLIGTDEAHISWLDKEQLTELKQLLTDLQ